jgi:excisionase family DNA binding protein
VEGDYYTTGEAARILRVTESRIRQLLTSEELEGTRDMNGRWRVPQHAVHARMEQTRPSQETPRTADRWVERVAELERELGRIEGRLELTEATESTLRETLERERARADRLEGRVEVAGEQLQEERERADRLEAELQAERSKGFFSRLFGG